MAKEWRKNVGVPYKTKWDIQIGLLSYQMYESCNEIWEGVLEQCAKHESKFSGIGMGLCHCM